MALSNCIHIFLKISQAGLVSQLDRVQGFDINQNVVTSD